ncbi:hypothetical protein SpCBS45565_g00504 [Spizellomyces sp. 'palustris']|nr:hypothetical protein SpCBS45565_g00504 [Spizellomyces sp. 'palustris']
MPTYLIHFAQFHMEFRLPELDSLAILEAVKLRYDPAAYSNDSPFMLVELPNDDDARKLVKRSILVKQIVRLWADSPTLEDLLETIKDARELHAPYLKSSFKFHVAAFGYTIELEEQISRIERFSFLPFEGPIDLKNPDVTFAFYEDYGKPSGQEGAVKEASKPKRVFFGVLLASGNRGVVTTYDLKKRKYLGTTSMDAQLSLVMANQALVRPGSFVLDPFVGTGSFLMTCAHFGAFTMGADIDGRQIRGKDRRNIQSNAVQYGLTGRVLDNIVCDLAHHPWRIQPVWDAIVCDPPYGVRAGAKKIGNNPKLKPPPTVLKSNGEPRYPQTVPYEMNDVIVDLIDFAATFLVPGGRLVYWLPTVTEEYVPEDVPIHPQFKLVANSEQNFGKWARRLITMEKLRDDGALVGVDLERGAEPATAVPAHSNFRTKYFGYVRGVENL